jgi:hypothetical protein
LASRVLGDHRFGNGHIIGDPSDRRYSNLRPEISAQIIEMSVHHARTGMSRTLLDLSRPAGIFYETRRNALADQWLDQAQYLGEARQRWWS